MMEAYRVLPKSIFALAGARTINSIGAFVHPLLALILTDRLGLSKEGAGLFLHVTIILQGIALLIGGKLADSMGRLKAILLLQSLGALGYVYCGLAIGGFLPGYGFLMATVLGASSILFAMAGPAYDALVADITDGSNRKHAYALLYMGGNLGMAIGPVLGGFLFQKNMPLLFIGDGLTTLLSMLLLGLVVRVPVKVEVEVKKESNPTTFTSSAGPKENKENKDKHWLVKHPQLLMLALALMALQFVQSQWGFSVPLGLNTAYMGQGAVYYGVLASFNGVLVILFTALVTHRLRKITESRQIVLGALFYAMGFAVLLFGLKFHYFIIMAIFMTLGEVLVNINSPVIIANNTDTSIRGRMSAIMMLISGTGYALAPLVSGFVIPYGGFGANWILVVGLALLSTLALWGLRKKLN